MAISRKVADPAAITNASGEPEITLSVGGFTLSAMPPRPAPRPIPTEASDDPDGAAPTSTP